jgi:hypothetical protein
MTQEILLIKKGDFKTGMLSKLTAGEFHFYLDKIIFNPMGWSRIFNSAPITISRTSIINYSESFTIIGYSVKLQTRMGDFTLRFICDKLKVLNMVRSYLDELNP